MNDYPKILAIQSDKKELIKVEQFLKKLFINEGWPDERFNQVLLVVSEAVLNSIEHGNKNNSEKKVTLKVSCLENDLEIKVSDEGNGFDPAQLADPTEEENIRKEAGRGIFLMKSICNQLYFHDKGKCVAIKIKLT